MGPIIAPALELEAYWGSEVKSPGLGNQDYREMSTFQGKRPGFEAAGAEESQV